MGSQATREVKYHSLGEREAGDIWANRQDGVFVVISSRPARWHGEDVDVYAHVDTWYTIRDATPAEVELWMEALAATAARRELRKRLIGDSTSYIFDPVGRQLVSTMRRLDSYDDRWEAPAPVALDDEGFAIEQEYLASIERLKGHGKGVGIDEEALIPRY